MLLFPAATTITNPLWYAALTASSRTELFAAPSDKLATPGTFPLSFLCLTANWSPAMTDESEPWPYLSSTFTLMRLISLATPNVFDPISPATCVPWPTKSALVRSSL
ncbi:hypothetical protein OGAPHI_001985 [Ogataea philodendri]|uniref:Uncharacterized protein n=1 Tax=Ogataea philodendri TaxID=1378263 RepID=A0A9P8PAL2_9ASCO|nr:uncharacterized protein OGAPHI_001985 [Ogataea philodendri]KAH3668231.1 hypothetical protein OGAPHI_001985 [Ogataea philodendri]